MKNAISIFSRILCLFSISEEFEKQGDGRRKTKKGKERKGGMQTMCGKRNRGILINLFALTVNFQFQKLFNFTCERKFLNKRLSREILRKQQFFFAFSLRKYFQKFPINFQSFI